MTSISLEQFFKENPSVALGFSGGVDSSYLLYAGLMHDAKIKAYYVKTAFQPEFELRDAYRLTEQIGTPLTVIELDVMQHASVTGNTPDRCYYCKNLIFGAIRERATSDGYPLLIDGTNASDDADDRPGMRALTELGVRSPLREAGLTKEQVRLLSREAGLFTWDKPAYACLATRIPTGHEITEDLLTKVEMAENALFEIGFTDFRVRVIDGAARLQFTAGQMDEAILRRHEILRLIKPIFSFVLLDLEGR